VKKKCATNLLNVNLALFAESKASSHAERLVWGYLFFIHLEDERKDGSGNKGKASSSFVTKSAGRLISEKISSFHTVSTSGSISTFGATIRAGSASSSTEVSWLASSTCGSSTVARGTAGNSSAGSTRVCTSSFSVTRLAYVTNGSGGSGAGSTVGDTGSTGGGKGSEVVSFTAFSTSGSVRAVSTTGTSALNASIVDKTVTTDTGIASGSSSIASLTVANSTGGTDTGDFAVARKASSATSTGIVTDKTVLSGIGIVISASSVGNSRGEEDSADESNEKFIHF